MDGQDEQDKTGKGEGTRFFDPFPIALHPVYPAYPSMFDPPISRFS